MKRNSIYGVVLAAAVSAALPAAAEVNQQCIQQWQNAVSTRALGERCQSLDAGTSAKLKALEDSSLACAMAKATADEKAQLDAALPQFKAAQAKELGSTPCNESTKAAVSGVATKSMQK